MAQVEHNFYCVTTDDANSLGQELERLGHKIVAVEKDGQGYSLVTEESTELAQATINAANLQALAEEFDAVYDGFNTAIE